MGSPVSTTSTVRLFLATFVSAVLFLFGAGTLLLLFAPAFLDLITPDSVFVPRLPRAADRAEAFVDIDSIPPLQPYPALALSPEEIKSGDWIRIPAIGVNVPLALSPSVNDKDILQTLDLGAALYPNGIVPGRLGNTFISAHSTGEPWKGTYRFAFLKINDIQAGNVINLDYKGSRYTYTVIAKDIVTPTADFRVISDRPVPTVTLMACWPLWTTKQRMLIKAELTNITKLTPTPA